MNLQEQWEENLTLNYIEGDTSSVEELSIIWLNFTFYDCNYTAAFSKEDLEKDYLSLCLEGDSKLFDSCEEILEEKYPDKIKEQFKRYQDYLIAEEEEWNKPVPPLDLTKYKKIYWIEFFIDESHPSEPIQIERSEIVDIDYELKGNQYLISKRE